MTNYLKLSKVMMLVGALVFVSFYSAAPANAYGIYEEDDASIFAPEPESRADAENRAVENAYNNKSKRSANAAKGVEDAEEAKNRLKTDAREEETKARQAKADAEKAVSSYENGSEYTTAKKNQEAAAAAMADRVQAAKDAHTQHINSERDKYKNSIDNAAGDMSAAEDAYNACMKREGLCGEEHAAFVSAQAKHSELLKDQQKAVEKAQKDRTYLDSIKAAGQPTAAEKQAEKAFKAAEDKLNDLKSDVKKAEKEVTQTNKNIRKDINKVNEDEKRAKEKQIKAAEKDLSKAQSDLKSAEKAIEKHCAKDPNGKKCKDAQAENNDAAARIKAANKRLEELTPEETPQVGEVGKTTFDDDIAAGFAADAAAAQKRVADGKSAAEKAQSERDRKAFEESYGEYNKQVELYKQKSAEYAQAQRACSKNKDSEECKNLSAIRQEMAEAKSKADAAYQEYNDSFNKISQGSGMTATEELYLKKDVICKAAPDSQDCKDAQAATADRATAVLDERLASVQKDINEKEAALRDASSQYKEAAAACEYSKKLTSAEGRADAAAYCAEADRLSQEIEQLTQEIEELEEEYEIVMDDKRGMNESGHKGQVYMPFETNPLDESAFANDSKNIFRTMTRRAMRLLLGIKPLVYTFAGFGLIGFAFAAVFNKISWKWFANIAMGLFLVANLGRFIEYFVYPDINGELKAQKLEYGDFLLTEGFADAEYVWIDEVTPYTPPKLVGEDKLPDTDVPATEETKEEEKKRGFCKSDGGGLFAAFTNCIQDITATVQKASDAVNEIQGGINNVKGTVQQIKISADNIKDAAERVGKGDLQSTFSAFAAIGNNINTMIGSAGNTVNVLANNAGSLSNDLQDLGKSTDQIAEYEQRRNSGEATNQYNANLKGQYLDENGRVERRWNGEIAKQDSSANRLVNGTDKVVSGSDKANATVNNGARAGRDLSKGLKGLFSGAKLGNKKK